jgi:hypothetical protein
MSKKLLLTYVVTVFVLGIVVAWRMSTSTPWWMSIRNVFFWALLFYFLRDIAQHFARRPSVVAIPLPSPQPATPQQRKMMGLDTPGDKVVSISVRDWDSMRLAVWRSRTAWDAVEKQAKALIGAAKHAEGCPGLAVETEPCLPACSDREQRLSALVILSAARQFAPVAAVRPANSMYIAPSRERYSEMLSELVAAQAELEELRKTGHVAQAPPNTEPLLEVVEEVKDEARSEA